MIDQTATQLLACPKNRYVGNNNTFGLTLKVLHFLYYVDMKILFKLVIIFDQVKLDKIRCNIAEGFDCNVWEIAHIFHTACIRSMAISRLHKLIVYTNIEIQAVLLSTLQCNTYKLLRFD